MTMPVKIYLSVLDGQFGTASALSTILLAATGPASFRKAEFAKRAKTIRDANIKLD